LRQQQDRLLDLCLPEEINTNTFTAKGTELRDRIAWLSLEVEAVDRDHGEQAESAIKVLNSRNPL